MITLDRIIKDCEKKIAFRDYQMQDVEYLSDRNAILLILSGHFVNLYIINRFGLLLRL